jgi:hypothetical protein
MEEQSVVTLYICSRLSLPFGPGLLAATVGLAEIGALTCLSAHAMHRWGLVETRDRPRLEASLLATFTVAMLAVGGLMAFAP